MAVAGLGFVASGAPAAHAPAEDDVEGLHAALETEHRRRRALQAEFAAARASFQEELKQTELELNQRLEEKDADAEKSKEDTSVRHAALVEQLEVARAREAQLLQKNDALASDVRHLVARAEADSAELLALRARAEALSAGLADAEGGLRTADVVRESQVRDTRELQAALDKAHAELRELQHVERSSREGSQAQHERLNSQCESLARQAGDRGREADVLTERVHRLQEALRAKGLEAERQVADADERRKDAEARLSRFEEEAHALRDELKARGAVEAKLREAMQVLEVAVQDHKAEEQRVRQDLFKQKAATDERDLELGVGQRREKQQADLLTSLEERLRTTLSESESRQTALFAGRSQVQTLELELRGERDGLKSVRKELEQARAKEEAQRREAARELEERVSQRDAEIRQLQDQLQKHREVLCERSLALDRSTVDFAKHKGELAAHVGQREAELVSRDDALAHVRSELTATSERRHELETEVSHLKRSVEDLRSELARAEDRHATAVAEAATSASVSADAISAAQAAHSKEASKVEEAVRSAEAAWAAEATASRSASEALKAAEDLKAAAEEPRLRTCIVAEKEVMTSPRLAATLPGALPEGERWGSEIAALHRSVESLQAVVRVGNTPGHSEARDHKAVAAQDESASEVYSEPSGDGSGASVEAGVATNSASRTAFAAHVERQLEAFQRRLALRQSWQLWSIALDAADMRAQLDTAIADELRVAVECRARDNGLADVLAEHIGEPTLAVLKRLLVEFRQRSASTLVGMFGAASREAEIVDVLGHGRCVFGRLFHASLFLYQKLRALVPTELREPVQDPLARLMPLPFYVLPYKAQIALRRGAASVARGSRKGPPSVPARPEPDCFATRITELEESLPLTASSRTEVPRFLAHALRTRSGAKAVPQQVDRVDVLLVDSLTVYMSAWRSAGHDAVAPEGAREQPLAGRRAAVR